MKWTDAEDIGIVLTEKFPGIDPLKYQQTPSPSPLSMRSTRAARGPRCAQAMTAATSSAGPCTTDSTEPSPQLRTQPVTSRRSASRTSPAR